MEYQSKQNAESDYKERILIMTISQTKTMGMNMIPTAIVQDLKMKKK
jgi:hypothetical protein